MDKPWKVILAFTGIFLAGVLVGGSVALRVGRNILHRAPMGDEYGPRMMKQLTSELDLTADQQAKVEPIVTSASEELRALRRSTQRMSAAVLVRMQGEIAAQLTPEQKTKFDAMVAKQKERVKRFMEERAKRMKERPRP